jgi:hypothetical protein
MAGSGHDTRRPGTFHRLWEKIPKILDNQDYNSALFEAGPEN